MKTTHNNLEKQFFFAQLGESKILKLMLPGLLHRDQLILCPQRDGGIRAGAN